MRNKIYSGDTLTLPAPYDVVSGAPVLIGNLFLVASVDAKKGEPFSGEAEGAFSLPKAVDAVFAIGDPVYFDPAGRVCAAKAAGAHLVGVAIAAAGNGAGAVAVRLNGVTTTVAA
ncbi:hypothetical protein C2134_02905 [Chromobacterium sinusclupearum]|uniref:DUF2190 family protein n=1 Tax=Chromobacterium sinusclupearum TaxID=2077146 RepID=A0A2K4MT03_9NEIS|nr:DUF2190 family protein [Chromobacterium sinusclupearum]POB00158.1 hypothetical protein C2134_02905 [Chromobacterium sinusclupearum]